MMIIAAALFVAPADPSLQQRAGEVSKEEIASGETQKAIDEMLQIARGERQDLEGRVMVGLAGPQVGIAKRIILVDLGVDANRRNLGNLVAYVNPEIVWRSEEIELDREGCYSVDCRVRGIVPRAARIKLQAWDGSGNLVEEEWSGFTARIFQHEIDHLDGIRFPDRVGAEGTLHWVEEAEYPVYRNNYENWPVKCAWETWLAMKSGQ